MADGCLQCRVPQTTSAAPTVEPDDWRVRRRRALRRTAGAGRPGVLMLDVGGVVIPSLFESVAIDGFPAGPLAEEESWRRVQQGTTTEREYWKAVGDARPGLDVPALWRECSRVRDELRGALDALSGRVRLVAFTNDMAHFFGADWPTRFPELSAFDAIVEASKLGVHKPDPAAYVAACESVGERPSACLFVDDLAANLRGAETAGMATRLFDVRDPAGSVAAVLADLGLAAHAEPERPRAFHSSWRAR